MVYGGGASLFERSQSLVVQSTSLLAQWSMVVDVWSPTEAPPGRFPPRLLVRVEAEPARVPPPGPRDRRAMRWELGWGVERQLRAASQ